MGWDGMHRWGLAGLFLTNSYDGYDSTMNGVFEGGYCILHTLT
jgi:hypothetical protein